MWFLCILFLLFFGLVILQSADLYRENEAYSNGVVNHDSSRRMFCYRVNKSKAEIWEVLKRNDRYTDIKYRFDFERSVITFYSRLPDGFLDTSYRIDIKEMSAYSLLRVVQIDRFYERTKYCWLQNAFWSHMLDAVPVPYESAEKYWLG